MSKTVQDILNELEIEEVVNAVLSDNAPAEEKEELTNALARLKEMTTKQVRTRFITTQVTSETSVRMMNLKM